MSIVSLSRSIVFTLLYLLKLTTLMFYICLVRMHDDDDDDNFDFNLVTSLQSVLLYILALVFLMHAYMYMCMLCRKILPVIM